MNRFLQPLLIVMLAGFSLACQPSSSSLGILTLQGELEGTASEHDPQVRVFKGIPYAAPPLNELRWQPPQAAAAWTGTLQATEFRASCSQPTFSSVFVWRRGDFVTSEDCLYLNIWAQDEAANQPVMVWFHGGAHTSGQGHSKIFDGTQLAQQGVLLVSINYRLGPLGFLAHPWLANESDHNSAGNYGLLDKVAALNWVRDNIAQFGGDANNVTIFGQSAGSQSVCSLMTSPMAEGLFHKAIGQSAACVGPAPSRDANGFERGEHLVAATKAADLNALRAISTDELLAASQNTGWRNASRIVVDGWVLPEPQVEVFRRNEQHKVPLMLGSLANEGIELFPRNDALSLAQFQAFAEQMVGSGAPDLIEAYQAELSESPGHAHHAISTDLFMTFGMRRWAQYSERSGAPTYLYFMDHVPPAFHLYMPEDPHLELTKGPRSFGAYHSGDLAFVFGNTNNVGLHWRADDHRLSHAMVKYWTNFAKKGDPNGEGVPQWMPFEAETFTTQLLRPDPESGPGVRQKAMAAFAEAIPL